MNKVLAGALAGLAATVPMTGAMLLLKHLLPRLWFTDVPPHKITTALAKDIGLGQKVHSPEHRAVTWLSHYGFGAATGALYGTVADSIPAPPAVKGAVYGLAVYAASYEGWLPELNILPPAEGRSSEFNAQLVVSHLVWGATLGIATDRLQRSR